MYAQVVHESLVQNLRLSTERWPGKFCQLNWSQSPVPLLLIAFQFPNQLWKAGEKIGKTNCYQKLSIWWHALCIRMCLLKWPPKLPWALDVDCLRDTAIKSRHKRIMDCKAAEYHDDNVLQYDWEVPTWIQHHDHNILWYDQETVLMCEG